MWTGFESSWNNFINVVFINRHSPHLVTVAVKHVITYQKFIMPIPVNINRKRKMPGILITLEMPHNLQVIVKCIHPAITILNKNITWLIKTTEIAYTHTVRVNSVKSIDFIRNTDNRSILFCCGERCSGAFLDFTCSAIKNKDFKILGGYNLVKTITINIIYLHRHVS